LRASISGGATSWNEGTELKPPGRIRLLLISSGLWLVSVTGSHALPLSEIRPRPWLVTAMAGPLATAVAVSSGPAPAMAADAQRVLGAEPAQVTIG